MNTIYRHDGKTARSMPKNGKFYTPKELRDIAGGYIECIFLDDDKVMVINREARQDNEPVNFRATEIMRKNRLHFTDSIAGDVLITESKFLKSK
jgi:hypothetical protein